MRNKPLSIKISGAKPAFDENLINIDRVEYVSNDITAVYINSPDYKYLDYSEFTGTEQGVMFDNDLEEDFKCCSVIFDIDRNVDYYIVPLKWQYVIFIIEGLFDSSVDMPYEVSYEEIVR